LTPLDHAPDAPGVVDLQRRGIPYRTIHPGHVTSVEEAAHACGVRTNQVVKTLVIRRGEGDYVLVLVPGDRSLSWPKLRALLGVNRMTLPDADEALAATGYARGTITPLGLDLPVVADESIVGGEITLGTGQRDTVVAVDAASVIDAYAATVADVTSRAAHQ
jgi:Cys-tRNA(Pro)/Cys-tRNA(Cys) deacylase